ncbi:MAG: ion channel [Candidatus Nanohaloarchaea archaeon]|nr:ion channel [Candidatus Nanohaloarchaea archaeon]
MSIDTKEEHGVTRDEVKRKLLQKVASDGERSKQFIGARFRDLDLGHAVLKSDDNHPVDLSHARFTGTLDLSHTDVFQPLVLEGARIDGRFWANKATFESYVNARDVAFKGFAEFGDAFFDAPVFFNGAVFDGAGTFKEYGQFVASFNGAAFDEKAVFDRATFEGRLDCRESVMEKVAFDYATLDTVFLSSAEIETIFISAARARDDEAYVSFVNSTVNGGILNQPYYVEDGDVQYPDESLFYNFTKAEIGDIGLKPDADGELFRYLRIYETDFSSFDFSNYESYLAPDWKLHEYDGPVLQEGNIHGDLKRQELGDAAGREITYLKARKGAERAGYARAASFFFINQMRQRRAMHWNRVQDRDKPAWERFRSVFNYIGNGLMGFISGHGERPWRVVGSSMAVILLCALLYPFVGGITTGNGAQVISYASVAGPVDLASLLGQSLYFSTTTFTTLGVGDLFPAGDMARLLTGFESLAGALLVALLVFVLGKRA